MRIAAIIVTSNRLGLLKENLAAVRGQSRPVDEIFVVNNGSTDGTAEWLAAQSGLTVISQANLGSSGGQFAGIKTAYHNGHDWFWCMDDDTVPELDALEQLLNSAHLTETTTGFLASVVLWTDGTCHRMNAPDALVPDSSNDPRWQQGVPISSASFVSVLVRREAVRDCGLPLRELFLWYDDKEFTSRISRKLKGWLIPQSRVTHKTKENRGAELEGLNDATAGKFCYGLRNAVFFQVRRGTTYHFYNYRGAIRMILRTTVVVFQQCNLRNALQLFGSMVRGLFFNPQVEFP
jgi:rhamnopyranosyl-N-acetylglucosaminyl-diphospho-decaprenol beta-1,3/1,4-galactofuranosyltransferase